jgi:hypothetical protein
MMCRSSNPASEHQFREKVLKGAQLARAAHRSFFTDQKFLHDGSPTMRLDRNRFDSCVDHLTRAIYFHTFRKKWMHYAVVASPSFYTIDSNGMAILPDDTSAAMALTAQFLGSERVRGENPEVFEYGIRVQGDILGFAARFYGCVELYVASSPILSSELQAKTGSLLR